MNPLAPKPFNSGKHSLRGLQGKDQVSGAQNSQTLPAGMPVLSGNILKERLAKMNHADGNASSPVNSPGRPDVPGKRSGSFGKMAPIPVLSAKDLKNRRDSMNKAPPPPIPDSKKSSDGVPEFLRKSLKPTGRRSPEGGDKDGKQKENNKEDPTEPDGKINFRKSLLLFDQEPAKPPPKPKPKPRSRSKLASELSLEEKSASVENEDSKEEQKEINETMVINDINENTKGDADEIKNTENVCERRSESDDNNNSAECNAEEEKPAEVALHPKPEDFHLIPVPKGLSEWMNHFAKKSKQLIQLDSEQPMTPPPVVSREFKNVPQRPSTELAGKAETENVDDNDEIYDDVQVGEQCQDTYDDVDVESIKLAAGVSSFVNVQPGSISQTPSVCEVPSSNQVTSEEVYDDVTNSEANQEEIYDDVSNPQPNQEEIYDDVNTELSTNTFPNVLGEGDAIDGEEGEMLYEPVETMMPFIPTDDTDSARPGSAKSNSLKSSNGQHQEQMDKAARKKEEKERKEREKLEKKRREEAEKKLKKEEEERRKKEREERKRIEKERRAFNLKPDEDPVPIERHVARCDVKGKGKDLSFSKGELLDIISKNNCPKGKVLVQNSSEKLGYAHLKDLGIDGRKSLLDATSPVAVGVAFGDELYDDVSDQSGSLVVSLASSKETDAPIFQSNAPNFKMASEQTVIGQSTEGANGEEIYECVS